MDKWEALKVWRDTLISRYRTQGEMDRTTPIGRGCLMMLNTMKEKMEELEKKSVNPSARIPTHIKM